MNSRFSRTVSLSAILILAGSVVAGCSTTPDEPVAPASTSKSTTVPLVSENETKDPKDETPILASDAASTLNAFFATISSDSAAAMEKLLAEGADDSNSSDAKKMSSFRKNFAKSYEFISFDMDQKSADKLISSYSMIYMLYPDFKITANESGFVIDGEKAVISGDAFEVWMNEELQSMAETGNGNPGSVTMKFVNDKWLIMGYEAESIGAGEPELAPTEEYFEEVESEG